MKDLLFVSNGHGEDIVACNIINCLSADLMGGLTFDAWPTVGEGYAYRRRGIAIVGAPNNLPSCGFAMVDWRLLLRDLRAGWLPTHWRQIRAARSLRHQYRLVVGVGDIVPVIVAVLIGAPFIFVGSAKFFHASKGRGYTSFEKYLLRKCCIRVFPRDQLSADELEQAGVPNRFVGVPMMDGLEGTGDRFNIRTDKTVVAMLGGTRHDAEDNVLDLLAAAARMGRYYDRPGTLRFVFPVRSEMDANVVRGMIERDPRTNTWKIEEESQSPRSEGVVLRLTGLEHGEALLVKERFADVLRLATVAVGMAGTGNEQATGLGVPLIIVPSSGVQGERFVKRKKELFNDAAIVVARDAEEIARSIGRLLADPNRRARMAAAGRARMGQPGASQAIACELLELLHVLRKGAGRQSVGDLPALTG